MLQQSIKIQIINDLNAKINDFNTQKTISFILFFSLELQKENKLARLLEEIGSQDKMLVFVETKRKADELTRLMRRDGYPAMCIHGDKQQREREWVLGK